MFSTLHFPPLCKPLLSFFLSPSNPTTNHLCLSELTGGKRRVVGVRKFVTSGDGDRGGNIHFVGIGGSGISALAMLALKQGFKVSGSDITWSYFMDALEDAGASLFVGHFVSNLQRFIGCNPFAVVASSAVPEDNVEIVHAKTIGIPVYKRDVWLRHITENYKLIAIAGTHGKSTTTGMLSYVLNAMGHDITVVVGARVPQLSDGNIHYGQGPYFILEADEYDGCFLELSPFIAVVTNIEWEHVDFFEDEEAVYNIFKVFLHQIKDDGHIILCGDSAGVCALFHKFKQETMSSSSLHCHKVTMYGLHQANEWHASSIVPNSQGGVDYILYHWGSPIAEISLQLPGIHNVLNSLAVIATIMLLRGDQEPMYGAINLVKHHLNMFKGVCRRFEMIGKVNGCLIYDDYAHHPTEVRAVIQAARQKHPYQNIWVIFQPHRFSRLAAMMTDFAAAFSDADHVIVTEIFAAREINIWNVDGKDLADTIVGPCAEYIPSLVNAVNKLVVEVSLRSDQEIIILTLGAGDITNVGRMLHSRLQNLRNCMEVSKSPDNNVHI